MTDYRCSNESSPTVCNCFSQTYLSFVTRSPSTSYLANSVMACLVNGVFTASGTILNLLVLTVFAKSDKLRKDLGYYLLFVLSFSDLATSLLVHPLFILTCISELTGSGNCTTTALSVLSFAAFAGMSLLTSLVMNLERYAAIIYPFFYQRSVTRKRLFFAVLTLTVCWFVVIGMPFKFLTIQSFAYVSIILCFCLVTAALYLRIFSVARKPRVLYIARPPVQAQTGTRCLNLVEACDVKATSKLLMDLKLAKTYVTIVLCYFCCYLPDAAFLLMNQSNKHFAKSFQARATEKWVFTLVASTSTFNSVVFFWRNTQLRKEAMRIIKH